jgi:hypothetical protein
LRAAQGECDGGEGRAVHSPDWASVAKGECGGDGHGGERRGISGQTRRRGGGGKRGGEWVV